MWSGRGLVACACASTATAAPATGSTGGRRGRVGREPFAQNCGVAVVMS